VWGVLREEWLILAFNTHLRHRHRQSSVTGEWFVVGCVGNKRPYQQQPYTHRQSAALETKRAVCSRYRGPVS